METHFYLQKLVIFCENVQILVNIYIKKPKKYVCHKFGKSKFPANFQAKIIGVQHFVNLQELFQNNTKMPQIFFRKTGK
jgi:hypothetical protein